MTQTWHIPVAPAAARFAETLRAAVPELRTDRCLLRAPRLEDAPLWVSLMAPDSEGHLGGPMSEADAYVEFTSYTGDWLLRGHGLWTVTDHAEQVLGFVLVGVEPGDQEPELGWLFLPEARGKGLATEAAAAARDHALGTLGLPNLVSYIDPANAASARVAERLGAWRDKDFDGSQVWVHKPVAQNNVSTRVETEGRHEEDAIQTAKRGA
ncbi:MAG: GNAT family N-acetyltransferase [Tabrizicola sp.]|nr:GNAT family N-acetyltransferase [Tabrizicola sp.]